MEEIIALLPHPQTLIGTCINTHRVSCTCTLLVQTSVLTILSSGRGDEGTIKERIEQLKEQIAETTSDYEREKLEERLAKLCDGVAVVKVGGVNIKYSDVNMVMLIW